MAADLDDYDHRHLTELPAGKVVVFLVATYGEGDPTDNANGLSEYLTHLSVDGKSLTNVNYFACGLGNRNYRLYNRFVDVVDERLAAAGAQRLGWIGKLDEATGGTAMEDAFRKWKNDMLQLLGQRLGRDEHAVTYESMLEVVEVDASSETKQKPLSRFKDQHSIGVHHPYAAPVGVSRELCTTDTRNCIHMEFDISGVPTLKYHCGDHLAVWPVNPEEEVDRLVKVLGWDDQMRHAVIDIRTKEPGTKVPIPTPTARETILRHYLEICGPVSRELVGFLREFSPSPAARNTLNQMYREWSPSKFPSNNKYLTVGRLLRLVEPTKSWSSVPLTLLIEEIARLQPRYYSIASSPAVAARRPAITAAVVSRRHVDEEGIVKTEAQPDDDGDELFYGLATNYLLAHHRLRQSDTQQKQPPPSIPTYQLIHPRSVEEPLSSSSTPKILIHIRPSKFKLPANSSRPIIMIGAGTGVAPFRGFVQERARLLAASKKEVGSMMLFFGCRHPDEDFLYRDEWEHFASTTPLTVVTAFSRYHNVEDAGTHGQDSKPTSTETHRKVYVQTRLLAYSEEVVDLILNKGAYVYICGNVKMAKGVRESLISILMNEQSWEEDQAREWIERELKATRRLQEDVWEA
jgi:NADPH-ferrihemoprotein reductase